MQIFFKNSVSRFFKPQPARASLKAKLSEKILSLSSKKIFIIHIIKRQKDLSYSVTLSTAIVAWVTWCTLSVVVQASLVTVGSLQTEVFHSVLCAGWAVGPGGTGCGYRHTPVTPISVGVVSRQGHIWSIQDLIIPCISEKNSEFSLSYSVNSITCQGNHLDWIKFTCMVYVI